MAQTIAIEQLAETIMSGLTEYADTTTELVKTSVKQDSKEVKKEIQ